MQQQNRFFKPYLIGVTTLGLILIGGGLLQWINSPPQDVVILLIVLAGVSAWFTNTLPVEESSITYQVGSVPALVAGVVGGPFAAVLGTAIFNLLLWLIKPSDGKIWKRNWTQLGFNLGMHSIAAVLAGGFAFWTHSQLEAAPLWQAIIPWLPAAIIYEEVNTWILIGILYLQGGSDTTPWQIFQEDLWSSQISIFVLAFGGGFLAFATASYGLVGVFVFFLPILLSSYAFRLYTSKMKAHLDKLEEMVAERTKDLEELNRQKDLFLTFLTHDLMTPISSIRFSGERIKDDKTISAIGREHADLVLRGQNTLHNMVSNILDIEKLRVGETLSARRGLCLLQELIFHTTELMRPEAEDKEITLNLNLCEEPQVVSIDEQQIERVLFNLLSNALKYTPIGGEVSVCLTREEDQALVTVKDNGYGIPKEVQATVFDKYMRVKSLKDKAMGTGLGLAISKELLVEHQGSLVVDSEAGEGSTFTIRLPLHVDLEAMTNDFT